MSSTRIRFGAITPGTSVKKAGSRWQIEENGIARLFETFTCNSSELFLRMPARKSVHPTYPNLKVKTLSPVELEAGLSEYVVEYSGLASESGSVSIGGGPGDAELPEPVYRLQRNQRSEPINTHPNWDDIKTAAGEANIKYDDNGIFLGIGKDSEEASLVGVTDYLAFGAVFSKNYVSLTRPSQAELGTIDTPDNAPDISATSNWLKISADYDEEGDVFAVFEAWMLSAPGGWNSTIYTA